VFDDVDNSGFISMGLFFVFPMFASLYFNRFLIENFYWIFVPACVIICVLMYGFWFYHRAVSSIVRIPLGICGWISCFYLARYIHLLD